MKPICMKCGLFFRPKKTGFYFVEGKPKTNSSPKGAAAAEHWTNYKLWCGDVWSCDGCGAEIIVGTGHRPVSEDWHPDFEKKIKDFRADQFRVNDC